MNSSGADALLAAWAKVVERFSDHAAIFETSGAVARSFREIDAEATQLEKGELSPVSAGSVVAIETGNHFAWPALLIACLRRRAVILPLESTMGERDRSAAIETCGVSAIITAKEGKLSIEMVREVSDIAWAGPVPVLLKLTSGTTAAPRGIRFRSEQLLADCTQICDTMGIVADDLNFGVVPISHSYGFSNLLTPLVARGVPLVLSRDRMPRAVLDGLARTGATVFAGMPVFYQAFAEMDDPPPLPRLRLCISAGAPLPLELARKFRDKFGLSIHSFYGSSECGGICYDREAALEESGLVGEAMTGVKVELADAAEGASRVRVRSSAVGDGYFPVAEEERLGHGWFAPDDLMAKTAHGLRIVGRVSDLINVAGKKVNPADVEAELLAHAAVRSAVAFARESATRNQEVAACVVAQTDVTERALLDHCRRRLSGWQVPKRIFFIDEIPTNERGKVSRRELAARFAR
ncbi:MAG: acyl--CoA ligase [Verrucomicrobiota bacterium]|nr:acyl--CoA ligase [Verrucomicrobiota bacterium]